MSEWIPVTERLPERPDTVVVADADSVDCGWYYNGVWSWSSDLAACKPTHWMPLPQHPCCTDGAIPLGKTTPD